VQQDALSSTNYKRVSTEIFLSANPEACKAMWRTVHQWAMNSPWQYN